jgi:hypothetical protein
MPIDLIQTLSKLLARPPASTGQFGTIHISRATPGLYTRRAYVFTKDSKGNIRDISAYVTEGSVTRKIHGSLSRRDHIAQPADDLYDAGSGWSRCLSSDGPNHHLPQAPAPRPVRVFTGFLDKTPYLQLYPGVIRLQASCTLKRLLYTYFDPALPYMQSFLAAYGWMPDPQNSGPVVLIRRYG